METTLAKLLSDKAITAHFPDAANFLIGHVSISKLETEQIPPKLLQTNLDICVESLQKVFNECVRNCQFLDELKIADVSLLFKKDAYTS